MGVGLREFPPLPSEFSPKYLPHIHDQLFFRCQLSVTVIDTSFTHNIMEEASILHIVEKGKVELAVVQSR